MYTMRFPSGVDPKSVKTEVFMLPASFFMEKNGSVTNSGAIVQWRYKAVPAPGQALPDGEVMDYVLRRVRDLVHESREPKDEIIKKAAWTYLSAEDVLREINGRDIKSGELVSKTGELKPDGSTSSGCWIISGSTGRIFSACPWAAWWASISACCILSGS